jgi:hypothetical protein
MQVCEIQLSAQRSVVLTSGLHVLVSQTRTARQRCGCVRQPRKCLLILQENRSGPRRRAKTAGMYEMQRCREDREVLFSVSTSHQVKLNFSISFTSNCQLHDWKSGHKSLCGKPPDLEERIPEPDPAFARSAALLNQISFLKRPPYVDYVVSTTHLSSSAQIFNLGQVHCSSPSRRSRGFLSRSAWYVLLAISFD